MNEAATRKLWIDQKLALAGWNVHDHDRVVTEFVIEVPTKSDIVEESPTPYGNQFADYVLLDKERKPIAVVEAKKTSLDPRIGKEQARQYAVQIHKKYGKNVPFVFYSNGHDIYFWDTEIYPPRKIFGFPTLDDMERYRYMNNHRKTLSTTLIDTDIANRRYQIEAIRSVMESVENKRRKFLLVMATGTGKTRTCIALIDSLIRGGWCSRVLFLVDRIALQEQALETFKKYLPNLPLWPKGDERGFSKDRRIYVSTYPAMLNIIEQEKAPISSHFFDLIVIDESHRSIYNVYQNIIKYFDAMTLGLTATPRDIIDHNTFKLFDCESEIPNFAYSYDQAVKDGYLCDFEVLKLRTRFQLEGVNANTITIEDQKKLLIEGKDIEEINFEGTDLEKKISNLGTNISIVREFMEAAIKDENGVLPGKSIFFCISKAHARRIQEVFEILYPEYKGKLAEVIVSDDSRVYGKGGLLDQFKQNDLPRIAISVDMLDTGIDVREIVNLVFAKPVFSYTKFWQMIGRGTRLLDPTQKKSWCKEKDHFLIIDCWNNVDFFKLNIKGHENKQVIALPIRLFRLYITKLRFALINQNHELVDQTINHLQSLLTYLPKQSILIKEKQSLLYQLSEDFWSQITAEKCDFLELQIAPLFKTTSGVDFKAMRFEYEVQEFSIARLAGEDEKAALIIQSLIEVIYSLPLNIEKVQYAEEIIQEALTDMFWVNASENRLDHLVKALGPLMQYRGGRTHKQMMELNIKDHLIIKEVIEFGPQHERISTTKYREMVEKSILEMAEKNPLVFKIKNEGVLSDHEIEELATALASKNPYVTENLLRKAYGHPKAKLIQFIRHIIGLELLEGFETEVSKAFEKFIQQHNWFSVQQIRFLELLKNYIIEKRNIDKKDLVDMPFTQLHNRGILGLFKPEEINEIVTFTAKLVA